MQENDAGQAEQAIIQFLQQNPEFYAIIKEKNQLKLVEALSDKPLDYGRLRFKLPELSMEEVREAIASAIEKKLIELVDEKGRQLYSLAEKTREFLKKFRETRGKMTF